MTSVYDNIAYVYDSTRYLPNWVADWVAAHVCGQLSRPGQVRLLEIGAGTGRIASGFARGDRVGRYVGLDVSPAMLALLRSKLGDAVQTVVGDACRLPFSARRFDAVLSCHVLQMIPNLAAALAEIERVLVPGGLYAHCTNQLALHQQDYDQLWQAILAGEDAAYVPAVRYDMRRDDVVDLWIGRGAQVIATQVAQWRTTHRVGDLLAAYEVKAYPSCHQVTSSIFETSITRLRHETFRRYRSLDAELVSTTAIEIVIALPSRVAT